MKKNLLWLVLMLVIASFTIIGCGGGSSSGTIATDDTNIIIDDGTTDDGTTDDDPVDDGVDESTIAPVLTFKLPSPFAIYVDSVFTTDGSVTAWDNLDGDVTANVSIISNVDTSTPGEYTIVYSVTDSDGNTNEVTRIVFVLALPVILPIDSDTEINGTALACDPTPVGSSTNADQFTASQAFKTAVSSPMLDIESRMLQTSHNTIARLGMVMPETNTTGGQISSTEYHPIVMSYLEHYPGSDYEMGDGSADIGDPDNTDMVKVALSRDNGKTWKRQFVSFSPDSIDSRQGLEVEWDGAIIQYPPDAQKPDMLVNGNRILVAWNDKYCPSGNPHNLSSEFDPEANKTVWPTDAFAVNGPQGFIDYREENNLTGELEPFIAPNGKEVYQVPFSCIWTVRGLINDTTGDITWHAPKQLTTGTRDSNHIRLAASSAGFAITWQEDIYGLKSGGGAGPGEGWSGATTNRGSDIWYTAIRMADFDADTGELNDTKPVSANNFEYPVRITDNEQCQLGDRKVYCNYYCDNYGYLDFEKGNQSGEIVSRCISPEIDMLSNTVAVLDGDTGASRSALSIFETNEPGESVVVIGYEETKALTVKETGEGDVDQGTIPTDIEVEGKSVYFESFDFNAFFAFDESNVSSIQTTAMPIVSSGNIINTKSPKETNTSVMIYENARRLVIGEQIDSCDATTDGSRTFAILYKQSFETRGQSSDMFVRAWEGFKYSDIAPVDGRTVTNVSAQSEIVPADPALYTVSWSTTNLNDLTYVNKRENTFSPRIFLRGDNLFTGFEYTPYETLDGEIGEDGEPVLVAKYPANFHTNIYKGGVWKGPKNITKVVDSSKTTVDARFFTTPKGDATTGLESDQSNPNVLFVTWGTLIDANVSLIFETDVNGTIDPDLEAELLAGDDRITTEADLFYVRSTDLGDNWEEERNVSSVARHVIEEKEIESFASPDGKHFYNAWLQQSVILPQSDVAVTGLDSWFGRVDYNISIP